MSVEDSAEVLARVYRAYNTLDVATLNSLLAPECVMHVSGHHPLSGDYEGAEAIWGYLGTVAQISGGQGGFDVHAITVDEGEHAVALLTGRIRDFVRPVIHVWHIRNGLLVEFWDASFDQRAEDEFWTEVAPN